jgi:hypothetical protein
VKQATNGLYADHFSIRTAVGVRGRKFQPEVFDYEWYVDSNHGTDAYPTLGFPWQLPTPLHLEGQLRTPLFDARASPSILIQIPFMDDVVYKPENTYLITNQNIYNKKSGALLPGTSGKHLENLPPEWRNKPASSLYPMSFVDEKVVSSIQPDGTWRFTVQYTMPQDPAKTSCPLLPIAITVTASDQITKRTYRIHVVGSDRTSCAQSSQIQQFRLLTSRKTSKY